MFENIESSVFFVRIQDAFFFFNAVVERMLRCFNIFFVNLRTCSRIIFSMWERERGTP